MKKFNAKDIATQFLADNGGITWESENKGYTRMGSINAPCDAIAQFDGSLTVVCVDPRCRIKKHELRAEEGLLSFIATTLNGENPDLKLGSAKSHDDKGSPLERRFTKRNLVTNMLAEKGGIKWKSDELGVTLLEHAQTTCNAQVRFDGNVVVECVNPNCAVKDHGYCIDTLALDQMLEALDDESEREAA